MPKDAAYYREYRQRRKDRENAVPSGTHKSKFETSTFIAWDGEGQETGRMIDPETPEHVMNLFGNSLGETMKASPRLRTDDVLTFMLECALENPNAVHVIYGGTYDVTHILKDLSFDQLQGLRAGEWIQYRQWRIHYIPRKTLQIIDSAGPGKMTLWDVIGFFQSSFVVTIEKWLGKDYPDLALIREGKALRSQFADTDAQFIERYNNAELAALVKIMDALKESVGSAGLVLRRWDGAGAVASAIYKKHAIKDHIGPLMPQLETATRYAFFGGRIECTQFGVTHDPVHHYDVNSAYPASLYNLPSLTNGRWKHHTGNLQWGDWHEFSIFRVRWDCSGQRICPFPFRYAWGSIVFPERGEGWYWYPEVAAAMDARRGTIELLEAYEFVPSADIRPFAWVEDYYHWRQRLIQGIEPGPNGLEKIIKLGLNSLYGKLAQNVGYNPKTGRKPPFHSLAYAGYITSETRSKLYRAAASNPDSVIMLMTDGIVATEPLDVDVSKTKELGKWEYAEHAGMLSVQSGVYAYPDGVSWTAHSRGIDRTALADEQFAAHVLAAWGKRKITTDDLVIDMSRMIGTRRAAISDEWYRRRGSWHHEPRSLALEPETQSKRRRDDRWPNQYPGKGLVGTWPNLNTEWDIADNPILSHPYERPWDRDASNEYDPDDAFDLQEELWQ